MKFGGIKPLRFLKTRTAKGGSIAPNFIQGIYKLYMGYHIHGVFYNAPYKLFQMVFYIT